MIDLDAAPIRLSRLRQFSEIADLLDEIRTPTREEVISVIDATLADRLGGAVSAQLADAVLALFRSPRGERPIAGGSSKPYGPS
jgi:hypothetical protein